MNKWMLGGLQVLYKDADDTNPDKRLQSGQENLVEKATRKNIPVHEWKGWDEFEIPKGVNMIITAGFEPAIPIQVLKELKYMGLCIQPSLMPKYVVPPFLQATYHRPPVMPALGIPATFGKIH